MIEVIQTPNLLKNKSKQKLNRPSTDRSQSRSDQSEKVHKFKDDEEDKLEPSKSF